MNKLEIAAAEEAARVTSDGFRFLIEYVRPGMTEQDVANALRAYFRALGYDAWAFRFIIASGRNAAAPHHHPTNAVLKKGHSIVCDFGVRVRGICADMTRMLFLGTPSARQKRMYALLRTAQQRAAKKARAGVSARATDTIARAYLKQNGYNNRIFCHGLGHGVGKRIHQPPWLSPKKKEHLLAENDMITIEPGLYFKGRDGYRLEDMYLVTSHGVRELTNAPKDIRSITIT
ncbi:MAG: M24 family metallopeptidase [Patescibacteria group bacterium]|jgi:Xaa-Pro aminopeptidase